MPPINPLQLGSVLLLLLSSQAVAHDIPVVPASTMQQVNTSVPLEPPATKVKTVADSLTMTPGINQIVPVAIHHLNRIITPFQDPSVTTSSVATTETRQNVIYVGTGSETPVTLFITERGDESSALSLTIVPQRIPPREITLKMTQRAARSGPVSHKKAQRWEQSQPYVLSIRALMRQLALGELPQGYTLTENRHTAPVSLCRQPGLTFDFSKKQRLIGHHFSIQVGVVKNASQQTVEFKESSCGSWEVAAVAAWPKNVLLAGERTEVYVVQKQTPLQAPQTKRPSLLGGVQ